MKSKLMIALVVLALVFGMVLTACDDGAALKIDDSGDKTIVDKYFLGTFTPHNGNPADTLYSGEKTKIKNNNYSASKPELGPQYFSPVDVIMWQNGLEYPYKGKKDDPSYPYSLSVTEETPTP